MTTASDGLDGINKAKELKPDIILLNFVMPKLNGFQVCRILQKDEELRRIPVILVSSKADKIGEKFVNQLGINDYLAKPFQPEELVDKVRQALELPASVKRATEVGIFPPNAFGLYDMHGNVWEWCADPWHDNYIGAPSDGCVWEEGGDADFRVLRGGSWSYDPYACRSAVRSRLNPASRSNLVGFRVVVGWGSRIK